MQWVLADVYDTCRCAVMIPAVHICIPRVRLMKQCESDSMDVKCWLRVSPENIKLDIWAAALILVSGFVAFWDPQKGEVWTLSFSSLKFLKMNPLK